MERRTVRPPHRTASSRGCTIGCRRSRPAGTARGRHKGIALVWVAIFAFVLIGILGLSMDWGKVAYNAHELHNAADAGALAGALVVKIDPAGARQNAIEIAFENRAERLPVTVEDNPANAADGEVVLGRWIRQENRFIETDIAPNAIKVVGKRLGQRGDAPPLTLHFGPVFGADTAHVSRHAIAWSRGSTGAGIVVLADTPDVSYPTWRHGGTGLANNGNVVIDLRGVDPETGEATVGDIQVNAISMSPTDAALDLSGVSATVYAGEINVVGWTSPAPTAAAWESIYPPDDDPFSVNPQSPPIADPLGDLVPPDISAMPPGSDTTGKTYYDPVAKTFETISGGTLTLNPGYYPGGIDMSGGNIVLNPGVYAFGGADRTNNAPGLVLRGGSFTANGVMLYITGDPTGSTTGTPTKYGRLYIGGNAVVNIVSRGDALTPPQIEGEMGIAIWQDRGNPTSGTIIGMGTCNITGTIYCGYNPMLIRGTADHMGNQVIAGALELSGTVSLGIAYDRRNGVLSYRSVLVK